MIRKITLWVSLLGMMILWNNIAFGQDLHTVPDCGAGFRSTPFKFSQGGYFDWSAPGTLSKVYPDVALSGHDITLSLSGNTGSLITSPGNGNATPNIDNALSDYADALSLVSSGIGNGNSNITITIAFSPAIPGNLGFEIFHVNRSGGGDKVKITAQTKGGTTINPNFTLSPSPTYTVQGQNTVNANAFTSLANSQLGVNFSNVDSISSVTIDWRDCNGCPVSTHGLGIGNFDFCRQFLDRDDDGIEDRVDVDDDNDGITDAMEACQQSYRNPDQDTLQVEIVLDRYPEETTWVLEDFYGKVLASGGPYNNPLDIGRTIQESVVMDADMNAVFRIKDSYGDALRVTPQGSYRIRRNNATIVGPVTSNWGFGTFNAISAVGAAYNPFACLGSDYSADDDGDGVPNYQDADFSPLSGAGVTAFLDSDGDGIIDPFDQDADNDGIADHVEAQGTACYQPPAGTVDDLGLPTNFVNYTNCADNTTADSYGVIPNLDADDTDNIPDYLDLDTDGDGIADFAEGFDFSLDGAAVDDYRTLADAFVAAGGSPAYYTNIEDNDGDLIPNWLDNTPFSPGFNHNQLPPFQDPSNPFYFFDTDNDGIVDLLDPDNNGFQPPFPPDNDADGNPDWRDLSNNTSLPVELASFDARLIGQKDGLLNWTTVSETGLSHFNIYRSEDGIQFAPVAQVSATGGNKLETYSWTDMDIALQMDDKAFYRLHAVDLTGTETLSEIKAIYFNGAALQVTLTTFPNPVVRELNIHLSSLPASARLSMYDISGRAMWTATYEKADVLQIQKDVSGFESGIYMLLVESKGKSITKKIVVN